jgi:type IV pilus assembly protein PilA
LLRFFVNQKRRTAEGGFTLIELVVVLAILGILIALAVPRYLGARKRAYKAEGQNILQELKTLEWAYFNEYNSFILTNAATADLGFQFPGNPRWGLETITGTSGTGVTMILSGAQPPLAASDKLSVILSSDGSSSSGGTF